ncbi:MAG: hypothetical protein WCD18_09495 [Thermosynechococcaceae cyanobacterium]
MVNGQQCLIQRRSSIYLIFMNSEFLDRIIIERDYKISLLRENLELGQLEYDILFQYLNNIATLQYRFLGHSDIMSLKGELSIEDKLKSVMQSFVVLEKSISFIDGIVAALSSDSTNRHLLTPYYGKSNDASVRDKIIINGRNGILEIYGLMPSNF